MSEKVTEIQRNIPVADIFYSIQGEGPFQGIPHIFIRFNGCNLKCIYCDSKYSKHLARYSDTLLVKDL